MNRPLNMDFVDLEDFDGDDESRATTTAAELFLLSRERRNGSLMVDRFGVAVTVRYTR